MLELARKCNKLNRTQRFFNGDNLPVKNRTKKTPAEIANQEITAIAEKLQS